MNINKEKLKQKINQHKILIAHLWKSKDKNLLIPIRRTREELVLVCAEFKCEKCKTEEDLQFHHLIKREIKKYTEFWKYLTQRNYFANMLLLCVKCHGEIEDRKTSKTIKTISKIKIDKVKKKYIEK